MKDTMHEYQAKAMLETWPVEDQHELAKMLAANCGYELIRDDVNTERLNQIKALIKIFNDNCDRGDEYYISYNNAKLIIEGLEGLLK